MKQNTWEMLLKPRAKRKVVDERSTHASSKTKTAFNMFMCFNGKTNEYRFHVLKEQFTQKLNF